MTCADDKKSFTIHIGTIVGKLDFVCDAKGKVFEEAESFGFTFTCPDPSILCAKVTNCPDNCNFK